MLAWPSFALLKKQYPDYEITALVPEYTAPMAEQCKWIDKVLIDKKHASFFKDILSLSRKIKKHHFDVSISLFSETRTSVSLWLAGVKIRIGPATKLAQIFLNKKLRQERSRSLKPEYEYNLDLVKYYIHLNGSTCFAILQPPYLSFDDNAIQNLKNKYLNLYNIPEATKIIIIHPGTGGSATNLSIEQYAALAHKISQQINAFYVITCGPGEETVAKRLSALLTDVSHRVHQSTKGVLEFSKFILISDLFISGSTGPLHIAGAMNMKTAAFYPSRHSATSLRWQTLNEATRRVAFTAPQNNMAAIDLQKAADDITHLQLAP